MSDIPKFDDIGGKVGSLLCGFYGKTSSGSTMHAKHITLNVKTNNAGNEMKGQMESIDGQPPHLGLIVSQKWSNVLETKLKWISDQVVFGEVALNDQLLKGSRFAVTGRLEVGKGDGFGVAGQYLLKHQRCRLNLSVCQEQNKITLNHSAVFRHNNWLAGLLLKGGPSWAGAKVKAVRLGYHGEDYQVRVDLLNLDSISASVYKAISGSLEAAYKVEFAKQKKPLAEFGLVFAYNETLKLAAKLDSEANVCLGGSKQLGPSLLVKGWCAPKKDNPAESKFGLGVNFEI